MKTLFVVIGVAVVIAHLVLEDPLLAAVGRLAGGSATAAVALGWAVFAVPAALAVAYLVGLRSRLTAPGRWVALVALAVVFMPAVALGPGRFSGFGPTLRDARDQAPRVADPLVTGLTAGCWANLAAGLLAIVILVKTRPWLALVPVGIS